jgi:hypothetical protein
MAQFPEKFPESVWRMLRPENVGWPEAGLKEGRRF